MGSIPQKFYRFPNATLDRHIELLFQGLRTLSAGDTGTNLEETNYTYNAVYSGGLVSSEEYISGATRLKFKDIAYSYNTSDMLIRAVVNLYNQGIKISTLTHTITYNSNSTMARDVQVVT